MQRNDMPLPRIHPRHDARESALAEVGHALLDVSKKYSLSREEVVNLLAELLHDRARGLLLRGGGNG